MNMQHRTDPRLDSGDEINLVQISFGILNFIRKNIRLIVIFNIAGIISGSLYLIFAEKIYSSRFTGECMLLPDGRTIEIIKDLDGLRKNEDWEQLGRRLGMKPAQVKKIKEFIPLPNATIDKESRATEDYASQVNPMPFSFSVIVKVSDNSILPQLQQGMVEYISNNPYNKIRVSRFIENRMNLLASLNSEIARLDSLFMADKVIRYKSVSKPETNNEIAYKDLLFELHEKKEIIEDELRFSSPVRVIQEFTAFKKPIFPLVWVVALVAVLGSNVICLIFIAMKKFVAAYQSLNPAA